MKTGKNSPIPKSNLAILRKELKLTQSQLATDLGINIKTYRDYEKGKAIPGSDILNDMYLYFNLNCDTPVSSDYILGYSQFRSPENDYIGSVTGLSDTAIHTLQLDKSETDIKGISRVHILDMINFFLSDPDSHKLLTSLYNYLFGNYEQAAGGETSIDLVDNTGIPVNGGTILISDINSMFLSSIMEILPQIKAKIAADPSYTNYGKFDSDNATKIGKLLSDIPSFLE